MTQTQTTHPGCEGFVSRTRSLACENLSIELEPNKPNPSTHGVARMGDKVSTVAFLALSWLHHSTSPKQMTIKQKSWSGIPYSTGGDRWITIKDTVKGVHA